MHIGIKSDASHLKLNNIFNIVYPTRYRLGSKTKTVSLSRLPQPQSDNLTPHLARNPTTFQNIVITQSDDRIYLMINILFDIHYSDFVNACIIEISAELEQLSALWCRFGVNESRSCACHIYLDFGTAIR